jgi:hypothetical protein
MNTKNVFFLLLLSTTTILSFASGQLSQCPGFYYLVRTGDTGPSIAASFSYLGCTYPLLVSYNPLVNFNVANLAATYQYICVPGSTTSSRPASSSSPATFTYSPVQPTFPTVTASTMIPAQTTVTGSNQCRCCSNYAILQGDTCYDIVNRYLGGQSAMNSFLISNPGINCAHLQIGQRICIPGYSSKPSGGYACSRSYSVVNGDICHSIATNLKISVANLYACNPSINSGCTNLLHGQVLKY